MSESSEILRILIDPEKPKVRQYEALADELSNIADKSFSWRYLVSVMNETVTPGREFAEALRVYILKQEGKAEIYARAVARQVNSDPKNDISGSYVMSGAKVCPICANRFVPNVPWRRFCPACSPVKKP